MFLTILYIILDKLTFTMSGHRMIFSAIFSFMLAMLLVFSAFSPAINSFTVRAEASPSSAGEARSDFNGDGYEDLAIGVALESFGASYYAGAVHVLYGSQSGLQTVSPADQFWSQDSPGISNYAERADVFGSSLAAGDFNNDGFADLAIGAPGESIAGVGNVGAVHVLYGTSSGLQTSSPAQQFWRQNIVGVNDVEESNDFFGSALSIGDFNNDGYSDLAIGATGETVGAGVSAGGVAILYGSSAGLSAFEVDGTGRPDQFWTQDSAGIEDAPQSADYFGYSLAAGDFNNDGKDDLAIGVPGDGAGAVNVLYGSSSGLQTSSPADQFWNQDSPGMPDSGDGNDSFGHSLASGDFNNDGYADLAIGNPREDVLHEAMDEGAVYVIYGSAQGLRASSPSAQLWTENSPDVEDSPECCDRYGHSLSTGDFNNDGYADLAIGALEENLGSGKSRAGAVNVLYGSSSGIQATSPADQFWTQDSPDVEDKSEQSEHFGSSLTASDFNNDGFADLAVGVDDEGLGSTSIRAGAVNVFYGSVSGLQTASPLDQFWHQNSPGVEDDAEDEDSFGSSLT